MRASRPSRRRWPGRAACVDVAVRPRRVGGPVERSGRQSLTYTADAGMDRIPQPRHRLARRRSHSSSSRTRVLSYRLSPFVEVLQKAMRRELDFLVIPLGGAVVTRDEAHTLNPPAVTEHERVAWLRVGLS